MKHFPGKFHEMAFSLLLTTIVAVLVACSSSEPTRTHNRDEVAQQLMALQIEVASLRTSITPASRPGVPPSRLVSKYITAIHTGFTSLRHPVLHTSGTKTSAARTLRCTALTSRW